MIDVENLVFDTIYKALIQQYPEADITDGYDEEHFKSPTVIVRETNNSPLQRTATDACVENHTRLVYEIEVISSKENTGRSECKTILNAVDDIMQNSMKFRRVHKNRPINIDRTRWRQYARYDVIVGKPYTVTEVVNGETVTTTVYPMYRR